MRNPEPHILALETLSDHMSSIPCWRLDLTLRSIKPLTYRRLDLIGGQQESNKERMKISLLGLAR